jgi:anti-sigma factor RsiW
MNETRDGQLMRRLAGELAPAAEAELDALAASDPTLGRREAVLRCAWEGLELAVSSQAPADLRVRVMERVRAEAGDPFSLGLLFASRSMRLVAVAALVVGAGLGAWAGTGITGSGQAGAVVDFGDPLPSLGADWVEDLGSGATVEEWP